MLPLLRVDAAASVVAHPAVISKASSTCCRGPLPADSGRSGRRESVVRPHDGGGPRGRGRGPLVLGLCAARVRQHRDWRRRGHRGRPHTPRDGRVPVLAHRNPADALVRLPADAAAGRVGACQGGALPAVPVPLLQLPCSENPPAGIFDCVVLEAPRSGLRFRPWRRRRNGIGTVAAQFIR